ncbi:hypothetical protein HMPREF9141_2546 [Prevotella multiformis DSM 16608]|uniref:Antitoxin SocA-like Panacea domain-containing protein n=2 Tax=Prevotella multiformis TaxID=282402 RepID=F0FAC9_9BACT|nr:hypothetical protein HMPREF9141_2546 [Prevotella multiformis DSM 16608]
MPLSSVDFANQLRNMAYKRHSINLNKTQVNKLLFMCYGFYLAFYNQRLFHEPPKAWPYGPVFPNVYKQYSLFEVPIYIPEEKNKEFENDERAKGILTQVVDKYSHISAYDLSLWSHLPGGPWSQTVYGIKGDKNSGWNKEISDDLIKNYFAKE